MYVSIYIYIYIDKIFRRTGGNHLRIMTMIVDYTIIDLHLHVQKAATTLMV